MASHVRFVVGATVDFDDATAWYEAQRPGLGRRRCVARRQGVERSHIDSEALGQAANVDERAVCDSAPASPIRSDDQFSRQRAMTEPVVRIRWRRADRTIWRRRLIQSVLGAPMMHPLDGPFECVDVRIGRACLSQRERRDDARASRVAAEEDPPTPGYSLRWRCR
jgi:hypothetical protein